MEDTTERRVPAALSAMLAGLQAGMVGALWMLAWLGLSAAWQHRGFWNSENLFATAFYGGDAVRGDFGSKTLPGLALYLLLYSLLGGIFALALRGRPRSGRLMLAGILFALGWFYISFHLLWKSAMPLVYLLYPDRPTVVGHLIFGACIGRFPAHYPGRPIKPGAADPLESAPPGDAEEAESSPSGGPDPLSGPPVAP
ncbi:MAG: hypothetical protein ABSG03_08625 [Bryobacteraceae bacterium]|jgi:hypothetical protein